MSSSGWKELLTEKRKEILSEREKQAAAKPVKPSQNAHLESFKDYVDAVKAVDYDYMSIKFKAAEQKTQDIIDSTAKLFQLNTEQERAFRIVANHASEPQAEKLKMYLGGMAGTGKS